MDGECFHVWLLVGCRARIVRAMTSSPEEAFDRDAAFPRLGDELIEVLDAAGRRRPLTEGELLFQTGDQVSEFFVVLRGRVAIVDGYGRPDERVLGVHGEARFVGELSLMTGEPAYNTAVVRESGEAIVLELEVLRRVIGANQQLGDLVLSAFIARRALLIGLGTGVRLIGSPLSPETRRLREFLTRNRIPHSFMDLESDAEAEQLLQGLSVPPRETPLVLWGSLALRNPSIEEVAEALHMRSAGSPEGACDMVVVGAGPAGLGAAVYAASEGARHRARRLGRGRWAGRHLDADRELPRLSGRDLRRGSRGTCLHAGDALRRAHRGAGECPGAGVRGWLPRDRARRRRATARAYRRAGDRRELSAAERGASHRVRGSRCVLRGHGGGGADVRRRSGGGRRAEATPPDRPRCSSPGTRTE